MTIRNRARNNCLLVTALALAACGIDQGGTPADEQAAQSAAVTYGPIDDFGSIVLNGETIGTSSASVFINGAAASEADLNIGQIVRVESVVSNGSNEAAVVEYQANVIGPVATVDAQAGTLTVLDQTIVTDAATRFNIPGVTSLADIGVDTMLEVSALERPGGSQLARYIGMPLNADQLLLATTISAIDANALQFTLGGANVDYSQAGVIDVPGGIPAVGLTVLVTGTALGNAGEIVADQVLQLGANPGVFSLFDTDLSSSSLTPGVSGGFTGFDANFIGFIETTNNASLMTINNVIVSFDSNTAIVGGTADDLNAGALVQVRGSVTSPGNVRAVEILIF